MNDISPYFCGCTPQESEILQRLIKLEGTPEAIREFCRNRARLSDYVYWFALGTCWVSYTGFSDLNLWKKLFGAPRPNRAQCLMKPSEYQALCRLPEQFLVFRAHRPGEKDWIAYTLDPDIAASRFATTRDVNEIKAYRVNRKDILALFLRRGEQEVLVLDKTHLEFVNTIHIVDKEESQCSDPNAAVPTLMM